MLNSAAMYFAERVEAAWVMRFLLGVKFMITC
jgi:hypothetical protein